MNKVSFDINEGEMVAFLGPNGAGKNHYFENALRHPVSERRQCGGAGLHALGQEKNDFKKQFSIVMGQKKTSYGWICRQAIPCI
ncbi:ATP-binding cassette domain-containing protein [Paenibacillus rhizoplanae]